MIKAPVLPTDPRRIRIAAIVAVVLIVGAIVLFLSRPHENHFEREAHRITDAIRANDLSSVANDFTPNTRAKFTRATVGQASDRFNSLGAVQSVRETTAAGSPDGAHDFVVTFEKGTLPEHIRYEIGGKIVTFRYDEPTRS